MVLFNNKENDGARVEEIKNNYKLKNNLKFKI